MHPNETPYSKRLILISVGGLLLVLIAIFLIWQPRGGTPALNADNPAFSTYIAQHTSGIISKNGTVRVELAPSITTGHPSGQEESRSLFTFYPSVSGQTAWIDASTVEFTPDQPLKPGTTYRVSFALNRLANVPQDLNAFNFEFRVVNPSFEIEFSGLRAQTSNSMDMMQLSGQLRFSDQESSEKIEQIITARYDGQPSSISWTHEPQLRISSFTIDSLMRQTSEVPLQITFDGKPIGATNKGQQAYTLPSLGSFKVLHISAVHEPDQHVLIQFSDPLLVAQQLEGLIELDGTHYNRFTIDGSEVRLYPSERLEENYTVTVHPGVENINAQKLETAQAANIFFENRLPAVSIPGKGTILPGTGTLTLPFEAVNLRAVDVSILRIYESNVPQYFQRSYDGNTELRRVGSPVVRTTIALDDDKGLNLRRKNRFSLDVDKLIKTEPGAIYRVLIGFRQSYSVYPCHGEEYDASPVVNPDADPGYYYREGIDEDDDFWARYNNYYPSNYDWNERDNPCHASYYTAQRWVSRDMLASNIGLIAKRGNDGKINVFATDLVSALPMGGVVIQLLDYQQQVIQAATTDATGGVQFDNNPKRPFLLIASKDNERGYLKLDDGSSLPLSRFDSGGDVVQDGIKGFIYTERGVWRPGDSLYVGFILEKQATKLPDDHPVTFELYDVRGRLFTRLVETKGQNGFYTFRTATDKIAPTGNWLAKINVGGATFQRTLKIETVMPNRLRIGLNFNGQKLLTTDAGRPIHLTGNWLFGAAAKNLEARVETTLSTDRTAFSNYSNYTFDDPTRDFATESQVLFDGTLDARGEAVISSSLTAAHQAPGMLQAHFTTRIFEPGGNFSIDYTSIPFSPYNRYVGVRTPSGNPLTGMLLTDQDHPIDIALVDPHGKPISGNQEVQVEFYKIRWNWWWNREAEYLGNFTQDRHNQLLQKERITLKNGKGTWKLRVNYPDWGRYLIRVVDPNGGHAAGSTLYIDWPGWAKREQLDHPTEASMLSFTADKDRYQVGETVTLTIPTAAAARGLISIENGTTVLETDWIDTRSGQTTYTFKVTADMAPNVFVNVTLLQPHAQTVNDLPIRMYGVIPLAVEDQRTILQPVIGLPAVLRPEASARITISEEKGRPMTYTVAIVDEGLLALTRFVTPDPHRAFYAREALGVKTWDLYDQVLGAWGGDLERILSIGGDADAERNIFPAKANRFESVVRFLGPFTLPAGAKNTHEFTLPQYVGSVRAMVVAGQEKAYGFAEKAVPVKKPLMLLASAPRIVGPQETFQVPLTVFSMEKGIRDVTVKLNSPSQLLQVVQPSQTLRFDQEGEQMAYFEVKTSDSTGIGKLRATAISGDHQATHHIEFDIRNPNPYITQVESHRIAPGQSWQTTVDAGDSDTKITVEISSLPPIALEGNLDNLIRSPYGGLEQVTSAVFPQLYLEGLIRLSDSDRHQIRRNLNVGIQRIRGYALPDGGFGYWPGASQADEWISNFAGHFLLEAKSKGYSVPEDMLERWTHFQRDRARRWTPSQYNWRGGDLTQAYRLYGLALAGSAEIGAMNRLKEFPYLSDEAAWRLAAAYQLVGQRVVAAQLIRGRPLESSPYKQPGRTFGSTLRDQAMILETLSLLRMEQEADRLLGTVAAGLSDTRWRSPQTTAYALMAIAKYIDSWGRTTEFNYTLDGKSNKVNNDTYLYQLALSPIKANTIGVDNPDDGNLYVRIIRDGQLPAGQHPASVGTPGLLEMKVRYTNASGEMMDPRRIVQGTDFIAEVILKNTGNMGTYENVALTQIFPSGWEIINARMGGVAGQMETSRSTYVDVRDDRMLTYFTIRQNETLTYRVRLHAAYSGRYFMPSVVAEGLHSDRIGAMVPGSWVEVIHLQE